jgi:hypothetical protein
MPGEDRPHVHSLGIIFVNFATAILANEYMAIGLSDPERGIQSVCKCAEKCPAVGITAHCVTLDEEDVGACHRNDAGGEADG